MYKTATVSGTHWCSSPAAAPPSGSEEPAQVVHRSQLSGTCSSNGSQRRPVLLASCRKTRTCEGASSAACSAVDRAFVSPCSTMSTCRL